MSTLCLSDKQFVDAFFDQLAAAFHCIVVDLGILDYKAFHRGDEELGFYEFYFQLLSRKLRAGNDYLIFTGDRRNRKASRLEVLKLTCNRWWRKNYGTEVEPVRAIEPRNSKHEDVLQIADVLLGAVGYVWNRHSGSPAKLELVKHIEGRAGSSLLIPSPPTAYKFNTWHWRPGAALYAGRKKAP
ncbi:MAG: DUF3800 domain-containing protein [Chloroflexi bacterium]|nr:DUF3800 domain-containing protein [Chloroflexota bacterium]